MRSLLYTSTMPIAWSLARSGSSILEFGQCEQRAQGTSIAQRVWRQIGHVNDTAPSR